MATRTVESIQAEIDALTARSKKLAAMDYLSAMIPLYEELENALAARIAEIQTEMSAAAETAKHLRVVKFLSEGGLPEGVIQREFMFDPSMKTRDCVIEVLRRTGEWMSTEDLARYISAAGKPLGEQAMSTVGNAMKDYLDTVFVRKKDGRKYLYALKELVNEEGEIESFKTSTSG